MVRPTLTAFLAISITLQAAGPRYEARIRRTSFGIPHIQARDFGGLGFGEGYAQAEDHLCTVADQVIRARGLRSRYFGEGKSGEHLQSDVTMKALDIGGRGERALAGMPPELQQWYAGYAAGYNQYLAETGKDKVGGWCRGAEWLGPITAQDLTAYQQIFLLVITNFAGAIASAAPPRAGDAVSMQAPPLPAIPADAASNGWGIGKDLSHEGSGMLIANPHYPWVGANRFWEKHLTIPGKLDVYGAGLIGSPGVAIGFNRDIAWTHTVSAGKRFTVYTLDLVPGKPTAYRYGAGERAMTSRKLTIEVKQADGSVKKVEREAWFTHYGRVIYLAGIGWTAERAAAARDTNWDNKDSAAQWLAMGRSHTMREFQAAHARYQGMPWVNTIASGREGIAWYTDSASTPNLSAEAVALWLERRKQDATARQFFERQGMVVLDGSDPRFEWQQDPGSRIPGVIGFPRAPQLERTDYVFNSNDSFWLANAGILLKGPYSPLQGEQGTPRTLRTRNNALTLSLRSPDRPAGEDGKFTLDELASAILSNRSLTAELVKTDLVSRCREQPAVMVDGASVELGDACQVLQDWNGRFDLDSRGAVLFREWLGQFAQADFLDRGKLFATGFDPADPVNTPRQLASGPAAAENLARAVRLLRAQNIALDVELGEMQFADKHGRRMPVHGGDGFVDGLMNMQRNARNTTTLEPGDEPKPVKGSPFLTEKGYPVVHGSSFLMAVEFTQAGPRAKAFLTYSESGDPASPHYTDQTELFARKQWRPVLFDAAQIGSDVQRDYKVKRGESGAR
jgi:acyl-homoserine-lactone acylase